MYRICAVILIVSLQYGCTSGLKVEEGAVSIDISKNYSEKQLLLKDIAEVTYVKLEAEDEYVFRGQPVAITENNIIIFNRITGDFLFFTHEGKPKSKFNRRGEGPGEYLNISGAVYDEGKDELFAFFRNNIHVYASNGEYKRSLFVPKNAVISELTIFDEYSLLMYDNSLKEYAAHRKLDSERPLEADEPTQLEAVEGYLSPFVRVSSKDGEVIEYIDVPENNEILLSATLQLEGIRLALPGKANRMVHSKDGFSLSNQETGKVFPYEKNHLLPPVVEQLPSLTSMDPIIYINNVVEIGEYQFFELVTLQLERSERLLTFPSAYIMRDKSDGGVYKQKIVLDDFQDKEMFISPQTILCTHNARIGYMELTVDELKEAYDQNKLSGRLKDMVSTMDEEDNNICVLLYFKQ